MILKMIKKITAITLIGAFFTTSHAGSLDELYESLMKEKREQIEKALKLENNNAFWEVYDQFQEKQSTFDYDAFKLIKKFHDKKQSGEISTQSMINMQAEFFRIEGRKLQNRQIHAEFFSSALSKEDVFRFYQIEEKIDALIRSKIAEKAPLIEPGVQLK